MFRNIMDIDCYIKWKVICNCRTCKTNKTPILFFFKCRYQNPWKLNRRPECLTHIFIKHPFHTVQSHFNPLTLNCHKLDFLSETPKSTSYDSDSKHTTRLWWSSSHTKACRRWLPGSQRVTRGIRRAQLLSSPPFWAVNCLNFTTKKRWSTGMWQ